MRRLERLRPAIARCAFFLASTAGAHADDVALPNQIITCAATSADVSGVAIADLHFGFEQSYAWANAKVRLSMRGGAVREYALRGRADPISKQLTPNRTNPGFAYPGFACTVQYEGVTAVRNCRVSNQRRTCDIAIEIFGAPAAFSVSMTAEPLSARKAKLP